MVDDSYEIIYEETPINDTPCELCTVIPNPYRNLGDSANTNNRRYYNPYYLGIAAVNKIEFGFYNPPYSSEHDGQGQEERGFWNFKVRNVESSNADTETSTVPTTDSSITVGSQTTSGTVVNSSVSNNLGTSANTNAVNDNTGSSNNIGSTNNNSARPSATSNNSNSGSNGSSSNSKPNTGSSSTTSNTNNAHIQIPKKACCGEWPSKYPYRTDRNRSCCGASILQ